MSNRARVANYRMDIRANRAAVTKPAQNVVHKAIHQAQAELIAAERTLPQLLNGQTTAKQRKRGSSLWML